MTRPLLRLTSIIMLIALAGCAGPKRLENPPDLPEQWNDRTLCTTEVAHVYAHGPQATDEIIRLIADVARDFEKDAGVSPPPVIVIVRDTGKSPWPMETAQWLVAASRTKAALDPEKADEPFDPEEALDKAKEASEESGAELDVLVEMMPLPCDTATLRDGLGAPDGMVSREMPALVLPTKALVRRNAKKLLKGALEKQDVGPLAQVALAPVLTFVEAKLIDALAASRNVAVYEYWANTHSEWTNEEKKAHAKAYGERIMSEAVPGIPKTTKPVSKEDQPKEEQ